VSRFAARTSSATLLIGSSLFGQHFLAELRDLVLTAERSILYCRGFNMEVPHAFMALMDVLKKNDLWPATLTPEQAATPKKDVLQRCWSMVNDRYCI
jgi:hypothetical protein